jgi:hypothetical protein
VGASSPDKFDGTILWRTLTKSSLLSALLFESGESVLHIPKCAVLFQERANRSDLAAKLYLFLAYSFRVAPMLKWTIRDRSRPSVVPSMTSLQSPRINVTRDNFGCLRSRTSRVNQYLLVWKDERYGGELKEVVRLARYVDPHDRRAANNHVELKRTDGRATVLRIVWRMLPRNGGRALFLLSRTVTRRAVTSTAGSETALRDGRTQSEGSLGDAALVLDYATLPKAAIYVPASCFVLLETCLALTSGFLTSSPTLIKRLRADAYINRCCKQVGFEMLRNVRFSRS